MKGWVCLCVSVILATWEVETGRCVFKASLDKVKPYLKNKIKIKKGLGA
jgi:hypothetical protein